MSSKEDEFGLFLSRIGLEVKQRTLTIAQAIAVIATYEVSDEDGELMSAIRAAMDELKEK